MFKVDNMSKNYEKPELKKYDNLKNITKAKVSSGEDDFEGMDS